MNLFSRDVPGFSSCSWNLYRYRNLDLSPTGKGSESQGGAAETCGPQFPPCPGLVPKRLAGCGSPWEPRGKL